MAPSLRSLPKRRHSATRLLRIISVSLGVRVHSVKSWSGRQQERTRTLLDHQLLCVPTLRWRVQARPSMVQLQEPYDVLVSEPTQHADDLLGDSDEYELITATNSKQRPAKRSPAALQPDPVLELVAACESFHDLEHLLAALGSKISAQHAAAMVARLSQLHSGWEVRKQRRLGSVAATLVERAMWLANALTPREMATVLCCAVQLRQQPSAEYLERMVVAATASRHRFQQAQDFARALHALAALRVEVPGWMREQLQQWVSNARHFAALTLQDFVMLASACARLQVRPEPLWMKAYLVRVNEVVVPGKLPVSDMVGVLRTLAELRDPIDSRWLPKFVDSLLLQRGLVQPADLVATLSSIATLQLTPAPERLETLLRHIASFAGKFNAEEVAATLVSLASMGHRPPDVWMEVFLLQARSQLHMFTNSEQAAVLRSLARLDYRPRRLWWGAFMTEIERWGRKNWTSQELLDMLWALGKLQLAVRYRCMDKLHTRLLARVPYLTPEQTVGALGSLVRGSRCGHDCSPALLAGLEEHCLQLLGEMGSRQVAQAVYAFAVLGHRPQPASLDAMLRRLGDACSVGQTQEQHIPALAHAQQQQDPPAGGPARLSQQQGTQQQQQQQQGLRQQRAALNGTGAEVIPGQTQPQQQTDASIAQPSISRHQAAGVEGASAAERQQPAGFSHSHSNLQRHTDSESVRWENGRRNGQEEPATGPRGTSQQGGNGVGHWLRQSGEQGGSNTARQLEGWSPEAAPGAGNQSGASSGSGQQSNGHAPSSCRQGGQAMSSAGAADAAAQHSMSNPEQPSGPGVRHTGAAASAASPAEVSGRVPGEVDAAEPLTHTTQQPGNGVTLVQLGFESQQPLAGAAALDPSVPGSQQPDEPTDSTVGTAGSMQQAEQYVGRWRASEQLVGQWQDAAQHPQHCSPRHLSGLSRKDLDRLLWACQQWGVEPPPWLGAPREDNVAVEGEQDTAGQLDSVYTVPLR